MDWQGLLVAAEAWGGLIVVCAVLGGVISYFDRPSKFLREQRSR